MINSCKFSKNTPHLARLAALGYIIFTTKIIFLKKTAKLIQYLTLLAKIPILTKCNIKFFFRKNWAGIVHTFKLPQGLNFSDLPRPSDFDDVGGKLVVVDGTVRSVGGVAVVQTGVVVKRKLKHKE